MKEEEPNQDTEDAEETGIGFFDHLEELRNRIIYAFIELLQPAY